MQDQTAARPSAASQTYRQIPQPGVRRCDPRMTAFALAGALNWMGHWYREDATLKPHQIAERFIDFFNHGLRGQA